MTILCWIKLQLAKPCASYIPPLSTPSVLTVISELSSLTTRTQIRSVNAARPSSRLTLQCLLAISSTSTGHASNWSSFRDAKQFIGLTHRQARNKEACLCLLGSLHYEIQAQAERYQCPSCLLNKICVAPGAASRKRPALNIKRRTRQS